MLDLQLQKVLEMAAKSGAPDFADLPPAASREVYAQICAATDVRPADVQQLNREIAGPGGKLCLRIYQPRTDGGPRGVILYLHGGGFVLGRADDYVGVCSFLCEQSDCVVVQVDYRLAPEHVFPAAVDDCYAALLWVAAHAAEFGGDAQRIALVGDSAGGNLAAVTAILARDRQGPRIAQQALIYPVTALVPETTDSYRRFGAGYTLTMRSCWYFTELYLGSRNPPPDFRAAPLLAEDLSGLPPALVLVGGYDALRDEGIAYAEKMAQAGTYVALVEYRGLAHGFISMGGAVPAARMALEQVASAVRASLQCDRPATRTMESSHA